jgi:hypothetical protein
VPLTVPSLMVDEDCGASSAVAAAAMGMGEVIFLSWDGNFPT